MPHQCIRCSVFYDDGAEEIIKGCPCGARLFFFIKKEKLEQLKQEPTLSLTPQEKEQVEKDVYNMIDADEENPPVVLDLEAIRILKPGKYELDIVHLFKGDPLVFKLADGKYVIDVAETFQRLRKK